MGLLRSESRFVRRLLSAQKRIALVGDVSFASYAEVRYERTDISLSLLFQAKSLL